MRRVQLFEIHDQAWFPAFLRDLVTDDLQALLNIGKPYGAILPQLSEGYRTHRRGSRARPMFGRGRPLALVSWRFRAARVAHSRGPER